MRTIWEAFAEQVERTPRAVAIRAMGRDCSYLELAEQADEAGRLIRARAAPGAVVALDASGPRAAAVAFLAAARSRCPIMPMNAQSPPLHRAAVLEDARPALIMAETEDGLTADAAADARSAGCEPIAIREAAYIIHTSGSTGRPKGVIVSHQALLERLAGLACVPGFRSQDSILAMTALSFDISVAELLLPLATGGCLVAAPPSARLDPEIFARVADEFMPKVIQATPSFWRLALASGWRGLPGSRIWCGGEALTPRLAAGLLPACGELWNLYGPTEATIWASAARIESAEAICLGVPLPGSGQFLADERGEPIVTPGKAGEIVLYGAGLADGYLNQPELTAARFCVRSTPEGPRLCFLTGDRAHYSADGTLVFLGRLDSQVKLRGNRIELGELEAVLEAHPAVLEAVALLRDADRPERTHIAAYVVVDNALPGGGVPGGGVTVRELRGWLAERLPAGARPGRIFIEPSLPKTTAGKVDRVRLADRL